MSKIEYVQIHPQQLFILKDKIEFKESKELNAQMLPQIYNGATSWEEVNLYAYDLLINHQLNLKTIQTEMLHLNAYANWLETQENLNWLTFPDKRSERCLVRFRAELIKQRENRKISPSTASQRMRSVVKFYRWFKDNYPTDENVEFWLDRKFSITVFNKFGFENTLKISSTDLAIHNQRDNSGIDLEGGISPINPAYVELMLDFAKANAPLEIYLMLKIGFYTGMRIGSITDLIVDTIKNFVYSQNPSIGFLNIGPEANPPVQTKFSKTGRIIMPKTLIDELLAYAESPRRLKRIHSAEMNQILFLTNRGNKYLDDKGKSINVAIHRLKKLALEKGRFEFNDFYFHRTRATFATVLMQYSLNHMSTSAAIQFVQSCCLHKDAQTTLKYVRFIENQEKLSKISDEYTTLFLGMENVK